MVESQNSWFQWRIDQSATIENKKNLRDWSLRHCEILRVSSTLLRTVRIANIGNIILQAELQAEIET